jgi:hypothetical protein
VARIDWWPAVPQVPAGEALHAVAVLEVTHATAWPPTSVHLRPGPSTADDPPASSVTLPSGPPFGSLTEYQQWIDTGNDPLTFNVVIPAEWAKGEVTLRASINALSPGQPSWQPTATRTVTFHRRHRARIRYRRHSTATSGPPTTEQAVAAIRTAAAMLPIPDPEIVVLGNDPAVPTTAGYIEDMFAERGANPTASWRDEVWLVVGPAGVGGFADIGRWPWIAATEATGAVTGHEIGHLFSQPHLALCGAGQNPEDPATFPDQGRVLVIGWDMWNNRPVRDATDFMSYCWANAWISPERWRRVFLQARPTRTKR